MKRSDLFLNSPLLMLFAALFMLACSGSDNDDISGGGRQQGDEAVNENRNNTSAEPSLARMEFPHTKEGNYLLIHTTNDQYGINYSVEWDPQKKAQRWTAYQMDSKTLEKNTSRSDTQYPFDPQLPANMYFSEDLYWDSEFDHGHMCPSADRLYSSDANYQTFFLTNMQPQYKAFNGSLKDSNKNNWSPWYQLEAQIRSWANVQSTETLFVVKGGTIEDGQVLDRKVKGEMLVPKYFFVALLDKNKSGYKAIGFWMEHKNNYESKVSLSSCAVNIDQLQQLTGIDFFCNLPDNTEKQVEQLPIENVKRAWGL